MSRDLALGLTLFALLLQLALTNGGQWHLWCHEHGHHREAEGREEPHESHIETPCDCPWLTVDWALDTSAPRTDSPVQALACPPFQVCTTWPYLCALTSRPPPHETPPALQRSRCVDTVRFTI